MARLRHLHSRGKSRTTLVVGVAAVAFLALNVAVYWYARSSAPQGRTSVIDLLEDRIFPRRSFTQLTPSAAPTVNPTPSVPSTPSPTPRPIYQGKVDFKASSKNVAGPQLTMGTIDPYDPKIGDKQTVTLRYAEADVSKVTVTLLTDTAKAVYPLTKAGDTWTGSWTMDSRHDYRYSLTFTATSPKGTADTVYTIR